MLRSIWVREELGGGGAQVGLAEAGVDLDHLATDFEFGDLAGEVAAIADVEAGDGFGGEDAALDGPAHEAGAGVAGPEGAVAVEDGDDRVEGQDGGVEFGCGKDFCRLRGSVDRAQCFLSLIAGIGAHPPSPSFRSQNIQYKRLRSGPGAELVLAGT